MDADRSVSRIKCLVPNCRNSRNRNPKLFFHTFPKIYTSLVGNITENGLKEKIDRYKAWNIKLKLHKSPPRAASAHEQQRRAETFLKNKKYDQSISCHKKAASLLTLALEQTCHEKAKESIELQIDYHKKRWVMIEREKKRDEIEKNRKLKQDEAANNDQANIEEIVNRTIVVHDSLIGYLGKRRNSDNDSLTYSTSDTEERNSEAPVQIIGNKHPKNDTQIIEELKVLSGQLRDAVQNLVGQLDDRNKEIERLKSIIKTLEEEKHREAQDGNKSNSSATSLGPVTDVFPPKQESLTPPKEESLTLTPPLQESLPPPLQESLPPPLQESLTPPAQESLTPPTTDNSTNFLNLDFLNFSLGGNKI